MAGFYSPWLAAVTLTRFNDDYCRYFMTTYQPPPSYDDEPESDRHARELYLDKISEPSQEMFYFDRKCSDLRALYAHLVSQFPGNAQDWLREHAIPQWNHEEMGSEYPFDVDTWYLWSLKVSLSL
jgi:hypothetical protein